MSWNPQIHHRPGQVYIVWQPWSRLVKIGLSRGFAKYRKPQLEADYGKLVTFALVDTDDMKTLEDAMHSKFYKLRFRRESWKTGHTEWFRVNPIVLISMIFQLHLLALLARKKWK